MKKIFINGSIVTRERVLKGFALIVEGERIEAVVEQEDAALEGAQVIDLQGDYLMPGFVDIHSDMIESILQPRSTAMMDFSFGLAEAERQLAACGITTIFHSVSMFRQGSWDAREIRTAPRVKELAHLIGGWKHEPHLIHNRYHLRYELDNPECYDLVLELMDKGFVQLLSLMDHRPGQGQYRNLAVYRRHLPSEGKNLTDEEFGNLVNREMEKPMVEGEMLERLAARARTLGIPVASHDDDTPEKVARNQELGVAIGEFPISMDVARQMKTVGIATLLGAPNILLGGSHSGNLSAEEAVRNGCADILCSDYYPQALLPAVFYLADKGVVSLPEACGFVSANPAAAAGIGADTGALEPGLRADMLVVSRQKGKLPRLRQTWVSGEPVLSMYDRQEGR